MSPHTGLLRTTSRFFLIVFVLGFSPSLVAQDPDSVKAFRNDYDLMMSNFERMAKAAGNKALQDRALQGREAMQAVTDDQLLKTFGQNHIPDLSVGVMASQYLATHMEQRQTQTAPKRGKVPLTPGFPGPVPLVSGCDGVDISADTRYALFIAKEVANSILAAAAWVCNEDILGENGSAACVPLAIAADIANGFFDTATFCAGEVTANQVDANFNRLDHLHDDLAAVQSTDNSIDSHLTNVDSHITNEFAALDAHIVSLFGTLGLQLANSTALLGADLKQVMKLELTPEGLRQIVPAILTCTGANCPDVLTQCTGKGAVCSWNNVGPLP
ncbi:MAG: hypothetical protein ACM3JH_15160 [Acidithiobacillales bacterium]